MPYTPKEQAQFNLIVNTINLLVRRTKMPVTAKVLIEAKVATRTQLRKLEKGGIIKCIPVSGGTGIMNAYYTEGELPDVLRPKQATNPDAGESSEGDILEGFKAIQDAFPKEDDNR